MFCNRRKVNSEEKNGGDGLPASTFFSKMKIKRSVLGLVVAAEKKHKKMNNIIYKYIDLHMPVLISGPVEQPRSFETSGVARFFVELKESWKIDDEEPKNRQNEAKVPPVTKKMKKQKKIGPEDPKKQRWSGRQRHVDFPPKEETKNEEYKRIPVWKIDEQKIIRRRLSFLFLQSRSKNHNLNLFM